MSKQSGEAAAEGDVTAGDDDNAFAVYEDTTAEIPEAPSSAAASVAVSLDQPAAPHSSPAHIHIAGLQIYQDTMLPDPAAAAAAAEAAEDAPAPVSPPGLDHASDPFLTQGSQGSAPAGSAGPTESERMAEPSENFDGAEEHGAVNAAVQSEAYPADAENAPPAGAIGRAN
jgi:hypothetical protein